LDLALVSPHLQSHRFLQRVPSRVDAHGFSSA
jgi:hypothetical protein